MAFLTQSANKSELVAGIIGTVDIGSIIGKSITLQQDIDRATLKLNVLRTALQASFNRANTEATAMALGSGLDIFTKAKAGLFQDIGNVFTNTRDQTIQGGAGFSISAAMLSLDTKLYNVINHVDLETKAMIDIPESFALYKLQKYYNKLFASNHPSDRDMTILIANGSKAITDLVELYQSDQSFDAKDAQNIANIRTWQIGKPNLYDAWIMARKGLKPDSYFYNIAKFGFGFTDEDSKALYQQFYYTFSPMEIFRISDLTPVSPIWVNKKLSSIGFSDEDKALVAAMIQARTLKDEVNQSWLILLDNYSWGLQTDADLSKFLTDNGIPDVQAKAKLTIAKLLREKVVFKLMRDAEIYLYRKDVLNEDQLLLAFQDLTISLNVANAITRNEACKKGIDWEIPA
jgi:hypothetical protein